MGNKSTICYALSCGKNGKIPIYYRDERRVFKVAFYVCKYCMNFSGFIDTWKRKPRRIMPYFNDMMGLIKMQLEPKIRISSMKKTEYHYCNKCKKDDYSRLFIRNRDKNSFDFTGYVCKHCRTCFFINTPSLKFRTPTPYKKSMGSFSVSFAEDEEKPIEEEVIITIKKNDIIKLKKHKIKFKYEN